MEVFHPTPLWTAPHFHMSSLPFSFNQLQNPKTRCVRGSFKHHFLFEEIQYQTEFLFPVFSFRQTNHIGLLNIDLFRSPLFLSVFLSLPIICLLFISRSDYCLCVASCNRVTVSKDFLLL